MQNKIFILLLSILVSIPLTFADSPKAMPSDCTHDRKKVVTKEAEGIYKIFAHSTPPFQASLQQEKRFNDIAVLFNEYENQFENKDRNDVIKISQYKKKTNLTGSFFENLNGDIHIEKISNFLKEKIFSNILNLRQSYSSISCINGYQKTPSKGWMKNPFIPVFICVPSILQSTEDSNPEDTYATYYQSIVLTSASETEKQANFPERIKICIKDVDAGVVCSERSAKPLYKNFQKKLELSGLDLMKNSDTPIPHENQKDFTKRYYNTRCNKDSLPDFLKS